MSIWILGLGMGEVEKYGTKEWEIIRGACHFYCEGFRLSGDLDAESSSI